MVGISIGGLRLRGTDSRYSEGVHLMGNSEGTRLLRGTYDG